MLNIAQNGVQVKYQPNFSGNFKKTEVGNDYYHTNSAKKIGYTFAGVGALFSAGSYCWQNMQSGVLDAMTDFALKNKTEKLLKIDKKFTIISALLAMAGHIGASTYIDKKRNEKAMGVANSVATVDTEGAAPNAEDMMLSRNGNIIHESKVGAKLGGFLGAGIGLVSNIANIIKNNQVAKIMVENSNMPASKSVKALNVITVAVSVGFSALGGWLLGKWSDNIANKDTYNNA